MLNFIRKAGQKISSGWDSVRTAFSAGSVSDGEEQPNWFRDKLSGFWFGDAFSWLNSARSRHLVNHETALRVSTVFNCVRIIAEEIGMMPLKFYRRNADGEKESVYDSDVENLMKNPNPWQTEMEFRQWMIGCLAWRGNAYAEITAGRTMLVPIHPGRVRPELTDDGRVVYHVRGNDGTERTKEQYQIFHLKLFSKDGVTGLSPIEMGAANISLDMEAVDHASTFFANQSKPGGFVSSKSPLTDEQYERLKEDVAKFRDPANRHKTPVFEVDLEWNQIGLSNKDSQFLESRKFTRAEIAAMFRVPLHMLNDLDGAKYNNMELQDQALLKHTLMPYLVSYEQRVRHTLIYGEEIEEERGLFAEFNAEGLLRGDSKTRAEVNRHSLGGPGTGSGWKTVNEIRKQENLPPLDDPRADMVYLGEPPSDPDSTANKLPPPEPEPDDPEEDDTEEEGEEPEGDDPSVLMVKDVTARLLKIETRNVDRRAKFATSDPDGFRDWCKSWYQEKHVKLCIQEMRYLAESRECTDALEHIAAKYCIGRCEAVLNHHLKNESADPFSHESAIELLSKELEQWIPQKS